MKPKLMGKRRASIEVSKRISEFGNILQVDKSIQRLATIFFNGNNSLFPRIPYSYDVFSFAFLYYIFRLLNPTVNLKMFHLKFLHNQGWFFRKYPFNINPIRRTYFRICKVMGSPNPLDHSKLHVNIIKLLKKEKILDNDVAKNLTTKLENYYKNDPPSPMSEGYLIQLISLAQFGTLRSAQYLIPRAQSQWQ